MGSGIAPILQLLLHKATYCCPLYHFKSCSTIVASCPLLFALWSKVSPFRIPSTGLYTDFTLRDTDVAHSILLLGKTSQSGNPSWKVSSTPFSSSAVSLQRKHYVSPRIFSPPGLFLCQTSNFDHWQQPLWFIQGEGRIQAISNPIQGHIFLPVEDSQRLSPPPHLFLSAFLCLYFCFSPPVTGRNQSQAEPDLHP